MAASGTKTRLGVSRLLILAAVLAGGGWVAGNVWRAPALVEVVEMPKPPVIAAAGPAAANEPPVPPAAESVRPRFDIVRVGPQGDAVIAGHAAAGAEVIVRDGDAEIARARADRQGSFVAIPTAPLAAGGRELTLAARTETSDEVKGDASVVMEVPARRGPANAGQAPVALLVPQVGAPRVLQEAPGPRVAHEAVPAAGVSLDRVDYDDTGSIRFTGGAAAGAAVRVYVDNGAAGDVHADGAGRWTLTPQREVVAGLHTLRVDRVDAGGRVLGRVELPFQRVVMGSAELSGGRVVVQPGQSLWRLARLAYGRGVQYRVIYLANREQIRDPKLIYPGQTFAVPTP